MKRTVYIPILIFFTVFQSCTKQSDSFQWRGPNRDGFYPEKNLLKEWPKEGPELAWSFEKLGQGWSSVAVANEKVYINGTIDSIGNLFAFDIEGNLLWQKEYGPEWTKNYPGARTSPLIHDNLIYLLSGLGDLICLKVEDGEKVWSRNIIEEFDGVNPGFGITENLVIDEDKLFCVPGGLENNVVALNRLTGETIWTGKGVGEVSAYCSPLLINHHNKKFFITMTDSSLISIDAETGKTAWRYGDLIYKYPEHPNTPIYKDGYLFAIDGGKGGSVKLKLNEDGMGYDVAWTSKIIDQVFGSAMLLDNKLFSYSKSEKKWTASNWETGELMFSLDTIKEGSIIHADDMFYCYSFSGEVALMKPNENSLELVSSFHTGIKKRDQFTHPVIKNGKLFLRYHDKLWVYNIAKK